MLTIEGFNANDAYHQPGRYPKFFFSFLKRFLVLFPELNASINPFGFNESGLVSSPIFFVDLGWGEYQLGDAGNVARLSQLAFDPFGIQLIFLCHFVGPQ